jgi:hypothetical protein
MPANRRRSRRPRRRGPRRLLHAVGSAFLRSFLRVLRSRMERIEKKRMCHFESPAPATTPAANLARPQRLSATEVKEARNCCGLWWRGNAWRRPIAIRENRFPVLCGVLRRCTHKRNRRRRVDVRASAIRTPLFQRGVDRRESIVERRAQTVHRRDDRQRDPGRNQAIFNRGSPRLIRQKRHEPLPQVRPHPGCTRAFRRIRKSTAAPLTELAQS